MNAATEHTSVVIRANLAKAESAVSSGICECGCGALTGPSKRTDKKTGSIKGEPNRFISGHQSRLQFNSMWCGGRSINGDGYVVVLNKAHPRANSHGQVMEHILIAEAAIGKPLPHGAVVHHTDEQHGQINSRGLVICPDEKYHRLIHKRSRAWIACGHPDWRKCSICKAYDKPENLYLHGTLSYHILCRQNRKAGKK